MSTISIAKDIATQSTSILAINDEFNNHGVGQSPLSNVFRLNYKSMLPNSLNTNSFKYIEFMSNKWTYNPELFCLDYYQDEKLAKIILLVNGLKSRFEFKAANFPDQIITVPISDIMYSILANR